MAMASNLSNVANVALLQEGIAGKPQNTSVADGVKIQGLQLEPAAMV